MSEDLEDNTHEVSIRLFDLTCVICKEIMLEPRILPCAHRLCSICLQSLISSSNDDKKCPTCRSPFKNSPPIDTFIRSIIEQIPIKVHCGREILFSNIDLHRKTCLPCLNIYVERMEKYQGLLTKEVEKMRKESEPRQWNGVSVAPHLLGHHPPHQMNVSSGLLGQTFEPLDSLIRELNAESTTYLPPEQSTLTSTTMGRLFPRRQR